MSWIEQEHESRKKLNVTPDRVAVLDALKEATLPIIKKEALSGDRAIEPLHFQPVHSPGIFEAEFAKKGNDLVFHFWPWGFIQAERSGKIRPAFPIEFLATLRHTMITHFGTSNVELNDDRDVGAYSVIVRSFGARQFWHELSVKAVTDLHKAMGGE